MSPSNLPPPSSPNPDFSDSERRATEVFDPAQEMPSFGPEWEEARRLGIDTAMLLENALRTPAERIEALVAHNRFVWQVQCQTGAAELPDQDS